MLCQSVVGQQETTEIDSTVLLLIPTAWLPTERASVPLRGFGHYVAVDSDLQAVKEESVCKINGISTPVLFVVYA